MSQPVAIDEDLRLMLAAVGRIAAALGLVLLCALPAILK